MNYSPWTSNETEDDGFASLADVMSFNTIIWIILFALFASSESSSVPTVESVTTVPLPLVEHHSSTNSDSAVTGSMGVTVKFSSRDGLIDLIRNGAVSLYGLVNGDGFQMIYRCEILANNQIKFRIERNTPSVGWKFEGNDDVAFFIKAMDRSHPTNSSLSDKNIVLIFEDRELEANFETQLAILHKSEKGGVLIITADHQIEVKTN